MKKISTTNNERGSLSLEHILFIGAVVLIAAGLGTFYGRIGNYFNDINLGQATDVGAMMPVAGGGGGTGVNP
jgi:prolipoprotein diacylglyceryltransferase